MGNFVKEIIIKLIMIITVFISSTHLASSADQSAVRNVWKNLDKTVNQCDDIFDYHPDGGMRIFYCHIKSFLSYTDIVKASYIPIYRKGPHTRDRLNLTSRYEFGYYNRDFVVWLKDYTIIATRDTAFKTATQSFYDKYVRTLAMTYHKTYKELIRDPQYLKIETDKYLSLIDNKKLGEYYADDFYEFKNLYQQGYNGNVVKTAVLFWLRRNIDGTHTEFFDALNTLVNTYKN